MANILNSLGSALTSSGGGAVVSGALGSIGNYFSQKSANANNLKIAQMNNDFQREMNEYNNNFNRQMAIDMFNMENAYNTPLAQRERLREAGLNPWSSDGSPVDSTAADGATAQSSGAGVSPSMATMQPANPFSMIGQLSKSMLEFAQATKANKEAGVVEPMAEAQIKALFADANNKNAQASYTEFQQKLDEVFAGKERNKVLRKMDAEIRKLGADYTLAMAQGHKADAEAALAKVEKEFTDTKNMQLKEQGPFILENLKKTGSLLDAQRSQAYSDAEFKGAQTKTENDLRELRSKLTGKQIDELTARVGNLHADSTAKEVNTLVNALGLDSAESRLVHGIWFGCDGNMELFKKILKHGFGVVAQDTESTAFGKTD